MAQALTSRVFEDPGELQPYWTPWDELAVEESQPAAAPAWAMAWWAHLRPEPAVLRVVLAWDGDLLVGVVPLFSTGRRYLALGQGLPATAPLAKRGYERQVAEQAAIRLAEAEPAPATIELDLHDSSPDWAALLCEAWPVGRRVRRSVKFETPVPRIDLGAGFEDWMSSRSAKFRRETRRRQRGLEKAECSFRYATGETLEGDVQAFLRLHRRRRAGQGGTSLTGDGIEKMLVAAGSEMLESGRLKVLCLEAPETPVAIRVVLSAGREVSMWNSGFDEDFAKLSPSTLTLLHVLADVPPGDRLTISLGPGGQSYKYQLCNEEDSLTTHVLLLPGIRYPLARLRLTAEQLRRELGRRLPPTVKRRLSRLARRGG